MVKRASKGASVPNTEIRLGGRKYKLRLDFNAFAKVEQVTGQNMLRGLNYGLSAVQLSALVWAALDVPDDDRPTIEDVRSQMGAHQVVEINNLVMTAIQSSMPDESPDDPETAEGNESGTGTSSSQSA